MMGTIALGGALVLPRRASALQTVSLIDATHIVVDTTVEAGKLALWVGGVQLGPLIDTFTSTRATTMRLSIRNVVGGTTVTAQWQLRSGGPWVSFVADPAGCHYDFPIPLGVAAEHRVVAHGTGSIGSQSSEFDLRPA